MTARLSDGQKLNDVVLVHGGFVDGSGWEDVYRELKDKGYNVTVVQNPTISPAGDVAVTKRAIAAQDGPVVLVSHSYGGVVVTEAGNDPKVAALVNIAAFAADAGESVEMLIQNPPTGAPVPPILPPQEGFLFLDRAKFTAAFCRRCQRCAGVVHGRFPGSVGPRGSGRKGKRRRPGNRNRAGTWSPPRTA